MALCRIIYGVTSFCRIGSLYLWSVFERSVDTPMAERHLPSHLIHIARAISRAAFPVRTHQHQRAHHRRAQQAHYLES